MLRLTAFLLFALVLVSCWDFSRRPLPNRIKVFGYKPVYSNDPSLLRIYSDLPKDVKFAGKIYVKDNYIFQNDLGYGIHVIDNNNPSQAKRVGFIHIPGNSEISIKGNFLYANSFDDLLVIDITNWRNAVEVKRFQRAFSQGNQAQPNFYIPLPEHQVYYECLSFGNGIQTGWIKDSIYNANCFYQ